MSERCPYCSFSPTSRLDYCEKHRPKTELKDAVKLAVMNERQKFAAMLPALMRKAVELDLPITAQHIQTAIQKVGWEISHVAGEPVCNCSGFRRNRRCVLHGDT